MDAVTQGLLGAAAAQAVCSGKLGRRAAWIGLGSGMAADLDALLSSASDPLFAVEFHRHFTHALAFIPVGGAVMALPWMATSWGRERCRAVLAASVVGYATHGLLDACTTYGTRLLWPFSDVRVGWDFVAIVDPLFTLALLAGVIVSALRRSGRAAAIALGFCVAYLGLGALQHSRALKAQARLAASRGHSIVRGDAFPNIGALWVWRSLYEADGVLHSDRLRVPPFGDVTFAQGSSVAAAKLPEELAAQPRIARDYDRFARFSRGYVALDPEDPTVFGDARYSLRDESYQPVWGVRFHPGAAPPTEWVNRSPQRKVSPRLLLYELVGKESATSSAPSVTLKAMELNWPVSFRSHAMEFGERFR